MKRKFKILDSTNKKAFMGYIHYDTDTKKFDLECLAEYKGKNPDIIMEKYSKLGGGICPDDTTERWIRARLLPHNRHDMSGILRENNMKEYDEMSFLDITKGHCAKDPYYFEEVFTQ